MDCAVDQMTLGWETTNRQQIIISNGKNWHQLQKETSFTFCKNRLVSIILVRQSHSIWIK